VVALSVPAGRRPPGARSRTAAVVIAIGLASAAIAIRLSPVGAPPLYDGVLPVEAYRWVSPPPGGHGGAEGASATITVTGGASPLLALATPEVVPQAQVLAVPGALVLPAGTTSLQASITPLAPTIEPAEGQVAGNVYRISVTTQAGVAVQPAPDARVTVVLRAPDENAAEGTLALLVDGSWQLLETDAEGIGGQFLAVVPSLGDFALIQAGAAASEAASAETSALVPTLPPPTSSPGAGETDGGIPAISLYAGIAIGLVLAGLAITAFFPGRRRRPTTAGKPQDRPPPRMRR
jgi:hypothetical protein